MTYLQFHAVFVLPPLLALALYHLRTRRAPPRLLPALAALVAIALVYTTPWDNYLVANGVWSYPPGRVWFALGYVPIEEYLFFVLQTVLTGLALAALWPRLRPAALPRRPGAVRLAGAALFGAVAVAGGWLLTLPSGLYLGLVLVWAAPVMALQWGFGGDLLLARWRLLLAGTLLPTLYLSAADRFALSQGIWSISPAATTGVHLAGLPLEEGAFFLATNMMITLGLTMVMDARSPARLRSLRTVLGRVRWGRAGWRAALLAWALSMVPVPLMGAGGFLPLAYLSTGLLALGALGLALERAGPRALKAAGVALAYGWAIELLGSRTGFPFGRYTYLNAGPELLGVPLLVPLGWFAFTVLALLLVPGRQRWWGAAVALVAWDAGLDPLMVHQGLWRFDPAGGYFGVPLQNFLGWGLAGAVLALLVARIAPGLTRGRAGAAHLVYLGQAAFIGAGLALFGLPGAGIAAALAMLAVLLASVGVAGVRRSLAEALAAGIALAIPWRVQRSLRRELAGVWVRDEGAVPPGGVVLAANHHSWWDGYLLFLTARRLARPFTVLMDARQLARFPFFRAHGAIGAFELRTALRRLRGGHLLAVFPEGALRPPGPPDGLAPGAAFLARRGGRPLVPVAVRVVVRGGQRPEAYLRFGSALEPHAPELEQRLASELQRLVRRLDDDLAAADPEAPPPGYRPWLPGRASADRRAAWGTGLWGREA